MQSYLKRRFRKAYLYIGILMVLSLLYVKNNYAQPNYVELVRYIDDPVFINSENAGLAFSSRYNAFLITSKLNSKEIKAVSNFGYEISHLALHKPVSNTRNFVFDDKNNRLLFFLSESQEMVEVNLNQTVNNELMPQVEKYHDLSSLKITNLKGIAIDQESGDFYLMDVNRYKAGAHIICLDQSFRLLRDISLSSFNNSIPAGIAFNPSQKHLYLISNTKKVLYEVDKQGNIISTRDLSNFKINNIQSMIFAPSMDQTDDPDIFNLYIMDGNNTDNKSAIAELTLNQPQQTLISAVSSTFTLVQTIATSEWSPPSPDPSGITYVQTTNTLLICDGEINEDTWNPQLWGGANVWEKTLTNEPVQYFNTLAFSDEPTDVAYNPDNQHIYFTDDTGTKRIYELDAGLDGQYGTSDNLFTSFKTGDFGSRDPEGITYDTEQGHLFIVDGVNREVYDIDPGTNGVFDGVSSGSDDIVSQFDVESLGIEDPEGVEFNRDTGNLYVLGSNDLIIETTRTGEYIQEYDISSLNAHKPAGLAYAPTSNNPASRSLYIVYRGIDNDDHPPENDGMIYEISINLVGSNSSKTVSFFLKLPETFTFDSNYPNPFNLETHIKYGLPKRSYVKLTIYNIMGKQVSTLVNGIQSQGFKNIVWNGRDSSGREMSSGTYIVQLIADKQHLSRKILLLK